MRGNLVTIAMEGDFGNPRPVLVIQADQFDEQVFLLVNRRSLQLQRWEESLGAGGDADGAQLCILSRPDPGFF